MSFSTPYEIPGHFKRQFSTVWDMVLQQQNQKFANAGLVESGWTAKQYIWQDLDVVAAREVTGQRLGDTNPQELSGSARAGSMRSWDIPVIKDKWDNKWLERQALPDSDIVNAMKAEANRRLDDAVIEAASATVYGGADPYTTPIVYPEASKIAVNYVPSGAAANSGLTPWKLLEAIRLLETAEVDTTTEELYLAISPKQKMELAKFVSEAPNDLWAKVIGDWLSNSSRGTPAKLMEFNVIITNRLPYIGAVANDIRACYAFARSGFKFSPITQELTIDRLPTKRNAIQFYSCMHFGALRTYDEKVIQIACDQSPPVPPP